MPKASPWEGGFGAVQTVEGFPLGGSCRRRRLMRGQVWNSFPFIATSSGSLRSPPSGPFGLRPFPHTVGNHPSRGRLWCGADCRRLPPGGKLSPQATDEGAGLGWLSIRRHLIRPFGPPSPQGEGFRGCVANLQTPIYPPSHHKATPVRQCRTGVKNENRNFTCAPWS